MTSARLGPPRLSIVVAAWTGPESLARCLAALRGQLRPDEDELIVSRNFADVAPREGIRDVLLETGANVPQLRAAGFAASSGDIIAFLEDHVVPSPRWREALMTACVPPFGVVGGPVDLAPGGRPLDWAVYFYDYARFAPPLCSGPVASLSGANVAYERAVLARLAGTPGEGLHEVLLESGVHALGIPMWLAGHAKVAVARREHPRHAIRRAFALARGYMGRRLAAAPWAGRLARVALAPLIPVVLFTRVVRVVGARPMLRGKFLRAAGWLLLLQIAWAAGEASGALWGVGRADDAWS